MQKERDNSIVLELRLIFAIDLKATTEYYLYYFWGLCIEYLMNEWISFYARYINIIIIVKYYSIRTCFWLGMVDPSIELLQGKQFTIHVHRCNRKWLFELRLIKIYESLESRNTENTEYSIFLCSYVECCYLCIVVECCFNNSGVECYTSLAAVWSLLLLERRGQPNLALQPIAIDGLINISFDIQFRINLGTDYGIETNLRSL